MINNLPAIRTKCSPDNLIAVVFCFFSLPEQMLKDGRNDRAWQNLCILNAILAKVASVYRQ